MHRVLHRKRLEGLQEALNALPLRVRALLEGVHVLEGVDPVFAGLHSYRDTTDGRSYGECAHVAYPYHQRFPNSASTTIVVPCEDLSPSAAIHELGHVLHERLGFNAPSAQPVTDYAETNEREAFAESFAAWVGPECYLVPWLQDLLYQDEQMVAFWESLAAGW